MRVGVIGAGGWRTLARRLAKRGHQVSIANSRGPESLTALAAEIGATPVSVVDAAKAGEIVIIAIPTKAVADLPRALFASVPSSVVVIDVGNYHPELRDGRIEAIDQGLLESQWVAQQIGRPVIKAFNNILARSLHEKGVPSGTKGRIALSVFGDSVDAKGSVLRLVDDLGFDPVDGGNLDESWWQQPGTPAYCHNLEAAALRRALAEADRSRIAEYRAEREARIRREIAVQTPTRDTATVIERFNQALVAHDGSLLVDLVSEDCVMESVEPAPDGTRIKGREACLAFWQRLAEDRNGSFAPEDIAVFGDRAIIRWRYRFLSDAGEQSLRGVTLMQVREGKVMEALGYAKSGDRAIGQALEKATTG